MFAAHVGLLVLLLVSLATAPASSPDASPDQGPSVACINPGWKGDQFWIDSDAAMTAAAHRLKVRLHFYAAPRPEDAIAVIHQLAGAPDRPDYILTTTQRGARIHILQAAEEAKIPTFIFNSGLLEEDRLRVGGPREHFKYWIGEMLPDEEQAGWKLANLLVDAALKANLKGPDGRVRVLALAGTETDSGALLRNKGLQRAIRERNSQAVLLQIVSANWFYDEAKQKSMLIFRRYPNVDVLWSANDRMALGAMESLRAFGREPGRDVMCGGMDWDSRALSAISDGKMVASIGGQILEGAWALVLLCDHYHGIDFASERLSWRSPMIPITKDNVDKYQRYIHHWEDLDFRRFSKFYNQSLKNYNFSIADLVEKGATPQP